MKFVKKQKTKSHQRFRSKNYNVFEEVVNKIALSTEDAKRIQSQIQ